MSSNRDGAGCQFSTSSSGEAFLSSMVDEGTRGGNLAVSFVIADSPVLISMQLLLMTLLILSFNPASCFSLSTILKDFTDAILV